MAGGLALFAAASDAVDIGKRERRCRPRKSFGSSSRPFGSPVPATPIMSVPLLPLRKARTVFVLALSTSVLHSCRFVSYRFVCLSSSEALLPPAISNSRSAVRSVSRSSSRTTWALCGRSARSAASIETMRMSGRGGTSWTNRDVGTTWAGSPPAGVGRRRRARAASVQHVPCSHEDDRRKRRRRQPREITRTTSSVHVRSKAVAVADSHLMFGTLLPCSRASHRRPGRSPESLTAAGNRAWTGGAFQASRNLGPASSQATVASSTVRGWLPQVVSARTWRPPMNAEGRVRS